MVSKTEDIGKKEVRKVLNRNHDDSASYNHRGRGRTKAEKRKDYAEYLKRKRIVFEAEERNFEHLVLFLASDGTNPEKKQKFYIMGGNSAIIYTQEIAPRIGRKNVNLRPDLDMGDYTFKYGVAAIADLEQLTEKLAEIGIEKIEKASNDLIVYFKLKRRYEKSEIRELLKVREKDIKEMNRILYATVVYPDINKLVMMLKTTVYHKVKQMSREDRELLSSVILEPVLMLADAYTLMAHGEETELVAAKTMMRGLDILMDRILTLGDLQLWDVSTCARVGKMAAELRILIKGKIINKLTNDEIKE